MSMIFRSVLKLQLVGKRFITEASVNAAKPTTSKVEAAATKTVDASKTVIQEVTKIKEKVSYGKLFKSFLFGSSLAILACGMYGISQMNTSTKTLVESCDKLKTDYVTKMQQMKQRLANL
ncbi:hypothetical protein WA158_008421 [Blastocystis sp. Blastoise]